MSQAKESSPYPVKPPDDPFHTAAEQLARLVSEDPKRVFNKEYQLVHGICIDPAGREYADAWLETKNYCCWWGVVRSGEMKGKLVSFVMEKPRFHEERNVKEHTVYEWQLAVKLADLHKSLGPWHKDYAERPLLTGPKKSNLIHLPKR
jgi:hypothetical protein